MPRAVKDELQIMCVTYTEDVGGVLTVDFGKTRNLILQYVLLKETSASMKSGRS